jgi:hypothetical protein
MGRKAKQKQNKVSQRLRSDPQLSVEYQSKHRKSGLVVWQNQATIHER